MNFILILSVITVVFIAASLWKLRSAPRAISVITEIIGIVLIGALYPWLSLPAILWWLLIALACVHLGRWVYWRGQSTSASS